MFVVEEDMLLRIGKSSIIAESVVDCGSCVFCSMPARKVALTEHSGWQQLCNWHTALKVDVTKEVVIRDN
jgi:hypothetical protein